MCVGKAIEWRLLARYVWRWQCKLGVMASEMCGGEERGKRPPSSGATDEEKRRESLSNEEIVTFMKASWAKFVEPSLRAEHALSTVMLLRTL